MHVMAQEGSEASVASSSPTPNWWEIHTNPILSWNAMNNRWPQPHSNSSCEEQDISMSTNSFNDASNHSALSIHSSSADLSGDHAENHLWSQVLFGTVGNGGGNLHSHQDDGENFLEAMSSKNLTTEMYNPACDYLKKLDSSWEFTANHSTSVNTFGKHLNTYNSTVIEPERLNNLSDLVSNWSIAPPNTLNHPMAHYSASNDLSQIKHELPHSTPGFLPTFMHEIKGEGQHQDHIGASSSTSGYQIGLNNSTIGLNNRICNAPWTNLKNLSDLISFGSSLNKPLMKNSLRGCESSSTDSKKQGYETSSSTKGSGRSSGTTSEGKKKRCDDGSETQLKKSKQDSSIVSSAKLQAPKVKLGEKITALQQIVSPFGKTDTASVLLEAINYIRFLQEQVQLLSDPYMKSNVNKEHNSWGGLERKEKGEQKLDLRSRGLCLVPISCTPQIYRETSGPDYWTPTYRGCLYR